MTESQHHPVESEAEAAGEHIHMPEPSLLPLLNAAALAAVIVTITLSPTLCVAAGIVFIVTTIIWIRAAVRETNELPLEHH